MEAENKEGDMEGNVEAGDKIRGDMAAANTEEARQKKGYYKT